jgi:hypothetical protein
MKKTLPGLALCLACAAAAPAMADAGGAWHVTGEISGNKFALDCKFTAEGTVLGGECTGAPDGNPKYAGKVYQLSKGSVQGSQVSWSYPTSYMFMSFNVNYAGMLSGDHMAGTVEAAGRKGAFSATRE